MAVKKKPKHRRNRKKSARVKARRKRKIFKRKKRGY